MFRFDRFRRRLALFSLLAVLLAPFPARAGAEDAPPTDESVVGVVFAV